MSKAPGVQSLSDGAGTVPTRSLSVTARKSFRLSQLSRILFMWVDNTPHEGGEQSPQDSSGNLARANRDGDYLIAWAL